MNDKLNGRTPATDDARAFVRGELKALSAQIVAAMGKTTDRATRLHLDDARDQIAKALDPKVLRLRLPRRRPAAVAGEGRSDPEWPETTRRGRPWARWPAGPITPSA